MAPNRADQARTLFLSHSTVPGGAELALVRMLRARPAWSAVLLRPPPQEPGVFAGLPIPSRVAGVVQRHGAGSAGALAQADNAVRLVLQAVATRTHPAFRGADVVVANSTRAAAYASLAARTSRVPFVVHVRDMADAEALGSAGAAIMQRIVLPRADGVIADTQRALDSTAAFVRPDALTAVIPSASALRPRTPRPRSEGPLVVGMLARIDPWKGQELLLEAFARAFPDGDARLQLAGSAPFGHEEFAAHLRELAADRGVSDRVDVLGHVDDVDTLLDGWDIAVQASLRAEPLGQNVLQYLAAGCATVVADEGGPTEWVRDGENGMRFVPRDTDDLARVLRTLADDPEVRQSLGDAASRTPGLRTDAEIAQAHAEFYDAVIARRASAARRRA